MTAGDIAECVDVLREDDASHSVDEWVARFGRDIADPDKQPVVAESGDAIVGYARTLPFVAEPGWPDNVAPDGYYLLGLVVRKAWRRQGVGRLLTMERLRWLTGRTDEVFFYTLADNLASQRLHEELGFIRVTDDFWFPGMGSGRGEVLYRLRLQTGR